MTEENFKVVGQLVNASNATLVVESAGARFVYKPMSGERPLWDFPVDTLFLRERAAFVLSELLKWDIVPSTTIADGPYGVGSLQTWIDAEVDTVDVFEPGAVPADWLTIVSGLDEDGKPVTLAHADLPRLQQIAVFDALINNADRKAGHILTSTDGKIYGIDHGVSFNQDPKLRTVLWGWIGQPIPEGLLLDLTRIISELDASELNELLDENEMTALRDRLSNLLATGKMPSPNPSWPSVPWPVF